MTRVAISVLPGGEGLDATMDDRFGRAEAFLVAERGTATTIETIHNASVAASRGAGTGAASLLKSAGIGAVISGRFGPKALDALRALGIEAWAAPPAITAKEALRLLEAGALEEM
jgi:predicted Fe-Mo cluster-binding NifX family protein